MSKTSSKSKYMQLMEWLPTLGKAKLERREQSAYNFSKAEHYKSQGVK
jgi:hypothetical protein